MHKIVVCEIAALSMLRCARGEKEFLKLEAMARRSDSVGSTGGNVKIPMLIKSMSRGEDLLFDAQECMSGMLSPLGATTTRPQFDYSSPSKAAVAAASHASTIYKDGKVSDKLSSAILDAWNGKNRQNQQRKMDFDILAPMVIIPENCTDPRATVSICNFVWSK